MRLYEVIKGLAVDALKVQNKVGMEEALRYIVGHCDAEIYFQKCLDRDRKMTESIGFGLAHIKKEGCPIHPDDVDADMTDEQYQRQLQAYKEKTLGQVAVEIKAMAEPQEQVIAKPMTTVKRGAK